MSEHRTPADIVTAEAKKWLVMVDEFYAVVPLVTAVANRLPGPPVWVMIVAPPASGKSELIMSVTDLPGVYFLSQVTEKTFVSGKTREAGDPKHLSLLTRLNEEGRWFIAIKELGTIQSLSTQTRNAIFGQLREIYDGQLKSVYGTGREVDWKGNLGLLVGCTNAADKWTKWNIELGDRFVQFRPRVPGDSVVALRAWNSTREGNDTNRVEALSEAFCEAFSLAESQVEKYVAVHEANETGFDPTSLVCSILTELIVKARTPIDRDRSNASVFEIGPSEGPARLTKVFAQIHQAAVICYGGDQEAALRLTARIGLDSVPRKRSAVLRELARKPDGVLAKDVATAIGCDVSTADRHLMDLVELGLVSRSRPVNKTVYRPSTTLVNFAEAVFMDEYEGPDALRKLFDLPTHLPPPHEGERVREKMAAAG